MSVSVNIRCSHAGTSCTATGIIAESDQSAVESAPQEHAVTTEQSDASVFESPAVKYADTVTTEQSDASVCKGLPAESSATTAYADAESVDRRQRRAKRFTTECDDKENREAHIQSEKGVTTALETGMAT